MGGEVSNDISESTHKIHSKSGHVYSTGGSFLNVLKNFWNFNF